MAVLQPGRCPRVFHLTLTLTLTLAVALAGLSPLRAGPTAMGQAHSAAPGAPGAAHDRPGSLSVRIARARGDVIQEERALSAPQQRSDLARTAAVAELMRRVALLDRLLHEQEQAETARPPARPVTKANAPLVWHRAGAVYPPLDRALFHAIERDDCALADGLIAKGANVNAEAKPGMIMWDADHSGCLPLEGMTPLQVAAYRGNAAMETLLLNHGADVNARGWGRSAALLWAVSPNVPLAAIKVLLNHRADVNARGSARWGANTALAFAALCGRLDVARLLGAHGAKLNLGNPPPLSLAVGNGQHAMPMVKFLVTHGADVNAQDNMGVRPVAEAAGQGYLQLAQFLVGHGAKLGVTDNKGMTPLDYAISYVKGRRCLALATLFIAHGAKVNDGGRPFCKTPLHLAVSADRLDVVRFLVAHGAKIDALDDKVRTPLALAVAEKHYRIVTYLRSAGARP